MSRDKNLIVGGFDQAIWAAHELKSPLALVRQLALSLGDEDTTQIEKELIIDKIRITAEKAIRFTSDITKVSNLEGALFDLEPINPIEICKEVVFDLQPFMKLYDKTIKLKYKKSHPLLMIANRDLLRRIILNFADNSLYYGVEKEIEMAIRSINKKQKIRVSLRDRGPQINKKQFFDLISNVNKNKNLSSRPESSGIGVSIASRFAKFMGGDIGLIRHKDGVTFYVDLDASKQMSLL